MTDRLPLTYEEEVVFSLRELYGSYGYAPFRMSRFEEYDLYARNKDFLVSDRVITFTDTDGKLLALKPDVTLSIVKNCRPPVGGTTKLYYDEKVFRVSEGAHAFREIRQVGLECIGECDATALAEVLTLAAESLAAIDGRYVLDVSHLGVVEAAIRPLGVSERGRAALYAALGEKNHHSLLAVLREEGVDEAAAAPLLSLLSVSGEPSRVLPELCSLFPEGSEGRLAAEELIAVLAALPQGLRLRIDFSVTHNMKYYNGLVFCGYLEGVASELLAGGQYDRLVRKLCRASGAVGFALYLDRLEGYGARRREGCDLLLLYRTEDNPADVLRYAEELRRGGARVLLSLTEEGQTAAKQVIRFGEEKK